MNRRLDVCATQQRQSFCVEPEHSFNSKYGKMCARLWHAHYSLPSELLISRFGAAIKYSLFSSAQVGRCSAYTRLPCPPPLLLHPQNSITSLVTHTQPLNCTICAFPAKPMLLFLAPCTLRQQQQQRERARRRKQTVAEWIFLLPSYLHR